MITVSEEIELWENLSREVSKVLSSICSSRNKVECSLQASTSSFDRAEHMMAEVYDFIDGRLQEIDPEYSERKAWGSKQKAQARKALSYGVNYQAFKGMPSEEMDRAFSYISKNGLSSMNYEATRQAILQFWGAELEAKHSRVIGKK